LDLEYFWQDEDADLASSWFKYPTATDQARAAIARPANRPDDHAY
jgi:hypothetical protein